MGKAGRRGGAQLHTQELMAEAARVTRVVPDVKGLVGGRHGKMKSEQSLPSVWLSQASPSRSHHRRAMDSSNGGRQLTTRYLGT